MSVSLPLILSFVPRSKTLDLGELKGEANALFCTSFAHVLPLLPFRFRAADWFRSLPLLPI